MNTMELFALFEPLLQPLINFLGTICLIGLIAAGTLYTIVWIINRIWRFLLAAGAVTLALTILGFLLGAA